MHSPLRVFYYNKTCNQIKFHYAILVTTVFSYKSYSYIYYSYYCTVNESGGAVAIAPVDVLALACPVAYSGESS